MTGWFVGKKTTKKDVIAVGKEADTRVESTLVVKPEEKDCIETSEVNDTKKEK